MVTAIVSSLRRLTGGIEPVIIIILPDRLSYRNTTLIE